MIIIIQYFSTLSGHNVIIPTISTHRTYFAFHIREIFFQQRPGKYIETYRTSQLWHICVEFFFGEWTM